MNSPWRCLEEVPSLSAVAAEWKQHAGDAFDAMREGFLQKANRKASSVPCPEKDGCTYQVKPRGNGFVGICTDDEGMGCDDLPLTLADVEVWEVNFLRLGRAIAKALQCDAKEPGFLLERTRQIASLGSPPLPVFLTIQHDENGFSKVVVELVARFPKGCILLAPTSRFHTADTTEMLARVNSGFFDLATHLTLLSSGALRCATTGAELFKAHLPEKQEAVKASEATRIFAILQKLKSRAAGEKAPLYDVFVATVLDGLSQSKAAKRCECSPAQISKRVKELKVEFGMPLKQLQNYAKPLLEMQTSVKGDRRRKRKPGSGPGVFADDKPDENDDSLPLEEYQYEAGGKDD
jgi:hypothetical protein